MKPFAKIAAIIAFGLLLSGCFLTGGSGNIFDLLNPNSPSVLRGGMSLVAKVDNPISRNDIGAVTISYNGIVVALNAYYKRPICPPGVQASWNNLCSEPAVRRELAKFRIKAHNAILAARKFRAGYKTVSAIGLVRAAGDAVADLKAIAIINGVKIQ